jgi:Leucine Rich repeats (2 copies)
MQHLTHLSLASNKLEAVPLELQSFTALRDLDLSHNLIYDLPSTLHSLGHLRCLSLHSNRIHVLPPVLTQMTRLTSLEVTANTIIYDGTAARVAVMPRLHKFTFPAPCDSFMWDHKKVSAMHAIGGYMLVCDCREIYPICHDRTTVHHNSSVLSSHAAYNYSNSWVFRDSKIQPAMVSQRRLLIASNIC